MTYFTRYSSILLFCFGLFLLPSCKQKTDDQVPAMLERKKQVGPDEEKNTIRSEYDKASEAVKKDPEDLKQYITLATAFITEGRVTGNNSYYGNAAMQMLNKVTPTTTANKDLIFQALSLKSTILLNMHQFKQAMDAAQQGVAINNFNSGIYGALVDANVELGNYKEAVTDCDKMMSIRPDLRSYSRASYLRQIYGENNGAIEAMKLAVGAGMPGAENTEWARTTLGDLYLNNGKPDTAELLYRASLSYRPNYPFAMIGIARVEKAKKNYDSAIAYTRNAINILSDANFVSLLGDLYELKGDAAKAKETHNDVVSLLEEGQKDEAKDAPVKHNVSRELATAYLNTGNLDKALEYARTDLGTRPDNIDANELAGWIYYLKGDYTNARACADKMLATNTKNANKLYEAGAIYSAGGDAAKGQTMMKEALSISPYIDQKIISKVKSPVVALKQ